MPSKCDVSHLRMESVWLERRKYEEAECAYQVALSAEKRQKSATVELAKSTSEEAAAVPSSRQEPKCGKKSRHNKNKERKAQMKEGGKGPKGGSLAPSAVNKREEDESAEGHVLDKTGNAQSRNKVSLADEISRARQHIKNSLKSDVTSIASNASTGGGTAEFSVRIAQLESENKRLTRVTDELRSLISKLELRVVGLEGNEEESDRVAPTAVASATRNEEMKETADDDDVDLFASDEDNDDEKVKLHQERLKAYETKKSKKPALVAKSNIILDVKPWDDETDMKAMETQVRTIVMDGLVWGASKLVPLAYGIQKLQISCVVEDEKVSVDLLQEQIESFDDLVQSVDIAAFNKV